MLYFVEVQGSHGVVLAVVEAGDEMAARSLAIKIAKEKRLIPEVGLTDPQANVVPLELTGKTRIVHARVVVAGIHVG